MRILRSIARGRAADPQHFLALSLALAAVLIAIPAGPGRLASVLALAVGYLVIAEVLSLRRLPDRVRRFGRLSLAVAFVSVTAWTAPFAWPTPPAVLYLPVMAFAASLGSRTAVAVGAVSALLFVLPMAFVPAVSEAAAEHWLGTAAAGLILAFGSSRTVRSLERALDRSRDVLVRDRRRSRQLAAVEAIGERLAMEGPTPEAIDGVVGSLAERFGYRFVSLYLGDQSEVRLAAQRGYDDPITVFDGSRGIVARVMRTARPVFLPDTSVDPEFVAASDGLVSEICVPLMAERRFRGLVNVEATAEQPLDRSDLAAVSLVAERIASAIALGERHAEARARADVFKGLTTFTQSVAAILEPAELHSRTVDLVAGLVASDMVVLVLRDETGAYRLVAIHGGDPRYVGIEVTPGEGLTGGAIARGELIVEERLERDRFPLAARTASVADVLTGCAVPLVHKGEVIGALAVTRSDTERPFSALEQEVLPIIAGNVALAVANARLHAEMAETSIRDALTGLFNRRHLDASLDRFEAARARLPTADRRPAAAILFDLDHFGDVNKLHGHQVGDEVLRRFGGIIRDRFRSSDIVGRFGGEEFLVVLDGASRAEAVRIADEIRRATAELRVPLPDGSELRTTVSAGCSGLGPDVASAGALIDIADVGLQLAKRSGRDRVVAA